MIFLDTNIFLRYLTRDDAEKSAVCLALLQRGQAGEEATTSEVVLAEVAYVLSSPRQYKLSHADVSALDRYSTYPHLDFEDCLTVAQIEQQGIGTLASYDRGFDRVPGITRREPPAP